MVQRVTRLGARPPDHARDDLIGAGLEIIPFSVADAELTAARREPTRDLGLSLADRACLALAHRAGRPALTADGSSTIRPAGSTRTPARTILIAMPQILDVTGAFSRAALDARLAAERHARHGPVALLAVEIDGPDDIVSAFGPARLDDVRRGVAERLRERHRCWPYRTGNDDLVVPLTGGDAAAGAELAEIVRASVAIRPIAGLPVRVSVGVASAGGWHDHGMADRVRIALERARRAGGNAAVSDELGLVTPDEERFGPRRLTAPNSDVVFAPPSWWSVLTRSDPEPAAAPVPTPPNPSAALPSHTVADVSTGALTSDALAWHAAELAHRSVQNGLAVALVVTDLDATTALADRFGATAVDDVLREVARRVGEQAPAYRTGADAFTTVLVGDDARRAFAVAERIRASIAAASAGVLRLTASVGVASAAPGRFDLAELNRRAITAQAMARAGGGDQVRINDATAPGTPRALRAA